MALPSFSSKVLDFDFGFLGEGEGFDFWRERGFLRTEER